jgi:hypothetical protein
MTEAGPATGTKDTDPMIPKEELKQPPFHNTTNYLCFCLPFGGKAKDLELDDSEVRSISLYKLAAYWRAHGRYVYKKGDHVDAVRFAY